MNAAKFSWLVLLASSALSGCVHAPPNLYQWGSYEDQVYALYADSEVPVGSQLQYLESDYQRIRASNGAVPPGFHAHLGYLYFQLGKTDQAWQSFAAEKSLFPESAVFMDRLMARLKH